MEEGEAAVAALILSLRVLVPFAFHTRFVFLSPSSCHPERQGVRRSLVHPPHPSHPLARRGNPRRTNDFQMRGVSRVSGGPGTTREGNGGWVGGEGTARVGEGVGRGDEQEVDVVGVV